MLRVKPFVNGMSFLKRLVLTRQVLITTAHQLLSLALAL
jgi:hypothetical protein